AAIVRVDGPVDAHAEARRLLALGVPVAVTQLGAMTPVPRPRERGRSAGGLRARPWTGSCGGTGGCAGAATRAARIGRRVGVRPTRSRTQGPSVRPRPRPILARVDVRVGEADVRARRRRARCTTSP